MKDETKDTLAKAIADLKQRGASSEPPQELVNETLAQLAQAERAAGSQRAVDGGVRPTRLVVWSATRLAAAAMVLIAAGYAFGRITTPQPDIDELRAALLPSLAASLEPAIRERVVAETRQDFRQALATAYIRMSEKLTEQYRADLNRYAANTLAASNNVTNQVFRRLVEAFEATQQQERQLFASALEELDTKRATENAALTTAVAQFASHTQTELQRTNEIVSYLANTRIDTPLPNEDKPNTMN